MLKAQSAAEYVTLVALIFVLVAAMMLIAFRQQELTLALSTTRLTCIQYGGMNSSASCNEIRYYYVASQNVTIVPVTAGALTPEQQAELRGRIIGNLGQIFKRTDAAGRCMTAAYYSYCISFP